MRKQKMKFIKSLNNAANLIKATGKKTVIAGFLFSSLILSSANVAQAADQQAFQKLAKIKLAMAVIGYTCRNGVGGGYQRQGQTYNVYRTLVKGMNYKLVAAGNVHVKDIDIVLHDDNHNVIARDNSADSMPIVDVTPRWTGQFHAKVRMHRGKGYSYLMVCFRG
jgi:hypothetical protein